MYKQTQISDRDYKVLCFLWKWKVATTSAIHQRFFAPTSKFAAYIRLYRLEKAGYIQSRFDESATHCVWMLNQRGFAVVKQWMPELEESGYLPNNRGHDLIASAIHLGDGVFEELSGLEVFTEQELRRNFPEFYPEWLPQTRSFRPDGYWRVTLPEGSRTIALEVELNQKRDQDYCALGNRYRDQKKVDCVLWVVPRESMGRTIHRHLLKYVEGHSKHNFVLLEDVYQKGWQAKVFEGPEHPKSIDEILANQRGTTREMVFSRISLDTQKSAKISKTPQIFRPS